MAGRRRAARKLALNILYEHEISGAPVEQILGRQALNPGFEFAKILVQGVQAHRSELDEVLEREAPDWEVGRMPAVDRSLLRLALYEMLYLIEVPPAVSINEAVEMAKIYSTEESSAFINGVLGSFLTRMGS